MGSFDVVIVGAGAVGLCCARALALKNIKVLLLEQHRDIGQETSSRNSEVIHAGLYYRQGSLKAQLCVAGKHKLYDYCQANNIAFRNIGKVIVANSDQQAERLVSIQQTAVSNGVNDTKLLSTKQLFAAEPNVVGSCGLFSPSTSIIDSHQYMHSLLHDFESADGTYAGLCEVKFIEKCGSEFYVVVDSQGQTVSIRCSRLVNSAGLSATILASKIEPLAQNMIPESYLCKGSYFSYQGKSPFNHLVYPLPNELGLGIHATLDSGGQVKFGPDTEILTTLNAEPPNANDYRVSELSKFRFVEAIQHYFPAIDQEKLQPAYAGIRPKLRTPVGQQQDFIIQTEQLHGVKGLINLYGIESPGLTASLAIGDTVCDALL